MERDCWRQVDTIFKSALELEPAERARFLDEVCASDESLRKEVESLIAHDEAASFMATPASQEAARLLVEDAAELVTGQTIGPYSIVKKLGSGGMGEVYLAKDTRLNRPVALKLLYGHLTRDDERVRRFRQEALAASALNHPNIITIYEIGQWDGDRDFIATEFVDGVTLRGRMRRRQSLASAIEFALQIAGALSAAHGAGIVHRDIKPENIMVRPDGLVKVLDFGIAKYTVTADARALKGSTVKTMPGAVIGTAAYMSPEQARGLETDARTDIWSLGVILYEMVARRLPFSGATPTDRIAAIIEREPEPLGKLRRGVPPELERIINRALAKKREERYAKASDMAADLRTLSATLEDERPTRFALPRPARSFIAGSRSRVLAALAIFLLALAGAGFGLHRLLRGTHAPLPAFQKVSLERLADTGQAVDAAVSPDGEFFVYIKEEAGRQSLWLRQTSAANSIPVVPHAEGQRFGAPLFSPDGAFIYYLRAPQGDLRATLYRVPKLGGSAETKLVENVSLQDTNNNVAISPDGKQLAFVRLDPGFNRSLVITNHDGGDERVLHSRPLPEFLSGAAWSPDAKTIACVIGTFGGPKALLTVQLADGAVKQLSPQRWNEIAGLVWLRGSSGLVVVGAQQGDLFQLWRVSYPEGEAQRITTDVSTYRSVSATSDSSMLATVQQNQVLNIWTTELSKSGKASTGDAKQLTFGAGRHDGERGLAWTPDGRIIFSSAASGSPDIFVINVDGTGQQQLTTAPGTDRYPAVTPDGRYVVFTSDRAGSPDLWRMDIDGGHQMLLAKNCTRPSMSPDGRWVVCYIAGEGIVLKVPIDGGAPVQMPKPDKDLCAGPVVSPDGRFIACNYLVAGPNAPFRIGVLPFEGGAPWKIFDVVGSPARTLGWTADSRALCYIETRNGVSNILCQSLDGGEPARFTHFKAERILHFDWSRDSKHLGLARGTATSDVVLIKDIR